MGTLKFLVWSWTASEGTVVGIYSNQAAALAAAQAVELTDGVIGSGYTPLVGSEGAVIVQGTNAT